MIYKTAMDVTKEMVEYWLVDDKYEDALSKLTDLINEDWTHGSNDTMPTMKELRKDIQNVIKQIQSSNDLEVLDKLKYQLKRIEDMGGFDKLVPSEGIVFIYKG